MDSNIDEYGRSFHRHLYTNNQTARPIPAILGLLATLADIYSWEVSYPIEKMFKLVGGEDNLRHVLGENILMLGASLILHETCGFYTLVYNDDEALVAIKPDHETFLKTVVGYHHEIYSVGVGTIRPD